MFLKKLKEWAVSKTRKPLDLLAVSYKLLAISRYLMLIRLMVLEPLIGEEAKTRKPLELS